MTSSTMTSSSTTAASTASSATTASTSLRQDLSHHLPTDARLQSLLADVVASWAPLAVYLYGAHVEQADAAGDYDLLVVVDDGADVDALDVMRASTETDRVGAEIVPTTRARFLRYRDDRRSLEGVVVARGVLVYGRVDG